MSKCLVISDIHNRIGFVESLIESIKPDFTVFLGDYFDAIGDNPDIAKKTALWLKDSIHSPNRWHILGNHDIPYVFPNNPNISCPGFTPSKNKEIRSIISQEEFDTYFNFVYFCQGWVLSHAGFHRNLFREEYVREHTIAKHADEALLCAARGSNHPFYDIGHISSPGCVWLHWDEFEPMYGIKQLVGHTFGLVPGIKPDNYCIDTGNRHYAILENGHVTIHNNDNL